MKTIFVCIAVSLSTWPLSAQRSRSRSPDYLALGDSLAFGFNPLIQPPDLAKYVGYPQIVAAAMNWGLDNASCPGETTGTFIGISTIYYPGFDCASMREQNELFVNYNGASNQLDYAVGFLETHPQVKVVTINIGVNDLGIVEYNCTAQYYGNSAAITACELAALPTTLPALAQNLGTIFSDLRATGFKGTIVALNAFAYDYNNMVEVSGIMALNTLISQAGGPFAVDIADTYTVFQRVSAPFGGDVCKAGLLIKLPDGTCDTHPNWIGQSLIANSVVQVLKGTRQKTNR